jgi:carboxyl-terminal processing protease
LFDSDGAALRERWVDKKEEFMSSYRIDEKMWQAYLAHAVESGLIVGTSTESADQAFSQAAIDASRITLEVVLKARIAQRLYRSEAWYPVFNTIDPLINSALQLWNHAVSLAERRTLDTNALEG